MKNKVFVAGWRPALRSEWPFIIIIIIGLEWSGAVVVVFRQTDLVAVMTKAKGGRGVFRSPHIFHIVNFIESTRDGRGEKNLEPSK